MQEVSRGGNIARLGNLLVRAMMLVLILPIITVGILFCLPSLRQIWRDFCACRTEVLRSSNVPDDFVFILIASEDHRNEWHWGIDPVSVARVLIKGVFHRNVGGASTIEQQLVRVLTCRYERSLNRKLKEQMLACILACTTSRSLIAKKYLEAAYFGTGKVGVRCFEREFRCKMSNMRIDLVIGIMARLKYPEPLLPSALWRHNFERRCSYIAGRLERKKIEWRIKLPVRE